MPKNAIIVGMARSGTSMTAAVFARKGYFVSQNEGEVLQAPDQFNPSGYWEAPSVLDANREVLAASGFAFDNTWMYEPISEAAAGRIPKLTPRWEHRDLVENFRAQAPWVWKDPRLCYTLGYWWPLMDASSTAVLLLTRDPDAIYRSFKRVKWRQDLNRERILDCVEAHLAAARRTIATLSIPHVELAYEDFSKHPDAAAEHLGSFFELDLVATDIGYEHRYDSGSARGKIRVVSERLYGLVPHRARRLVKNLVPRSLLRLLRGARRT